MLFSVGANSDAIWFISKQQREYLYFTVPVAVTTKLWTKYTKYTTYLHCACSDNFWHFNNQSFLSSVKTKYKSYMSK